MDSQQAALAICGATVAYALYQRYRNSAIRDVPGPESPSWIHGISRSHACRMTLPHVYSGTGHLWFWQCEEASVVEKRLLEEYGGVARWNGLLGVYFSFGGRAQLDPYPDVVTQEERLWIADPKAIHHIFQYSGDLYGRLDSFREQVAIVLDRGLFWAEGELHLTPHTV